jgi:hypothetical protein
MNEKKPNIKQMILLLEGRHHRYPRGSSKKININNLTDHQKLMILYHYNNTFGKSEFKPRKYNSDIYE